DVMCSQIVGCSDLPPREIRVGDDHIGGLGTSPVKPASNCVSSIWVPFGMPLVAYVVNREYQRNGPAQRGCVSRRVKNVQAFMADRARKIEQRPAEVRRKYLPDGPALQRVRPRGLGCCAE